MKATNAKDAKIEGRRFATLLCRIFKRNPDVEYEEVSEFAQYFAMEVLGYRDAEIFKGWVNGALPVLLNAKTPEQLSEDYANGELTFEQLEKAMTRAVKRALPAPKVRDGNGE